MLSTHVSNPSSLLWQYTAVALPQHRENHCSPALELAGQCQHLIPSMVVWAGTKQALLAIVRELSSRTCAVNSANV